MTDTTQNQQEQLFADTNISMKSGRIVFDPEIISDGNFIKFRLASNKQYKDAEGNIQEVVNYFNILVSANLKAFETAKELKKGDWVYIKGEDSSQYIDTAEGYKQNAVTTFAWKVVKKRVLNPNTSPSE